MKDLNFKLQNWTRVKPLPHVPRLSPIVPPHWVSQSFLQKFKSSLSLSLSLCYILGFYSSSHTPASISVLTLTSYKTQQTNLTQPFFFSHIYHSNKTWIFSHTHTHTQTQTLTETVFLERESKAPIQTTIGGLL